MSKVITAIGKTLDEAIENGLKELKCKRDDVEVKIIQDEKKKAFFSILDNQEVKVEITLKDNNNEKIDNKTSIKRTPKEHEIDNCKKNISDFLDIWLEKVGKINYKIEVKEEMIYIDLEGEDSSKLIGYRGDVINSLQNILYVIGNKNNETNVKIAINIGDYREKREETLMHLANKIEKTVIRTRRKVVLEPMSAYERKVIHTALQNSSKVTTYSIGDEPHRKIVVDIKR